MKALVSMTISPTSIFVARRFRDLGIDVTAVDSKHRSYCSYSNSVKKTIVGPSLRYNPLGFAQTVLNALQCEHYDFYFPVFECGFLMAYYRETIQKHTALVSMPYETILRAHNKKLLQTFGKESGVRVIDNTFSPKSLDEAFELCKTIDYPVVIKGQVSRNAHGQAIVLDRKKTFTEYQRIAKYESPDGQLPLIQRYIKGSLVSSVNFAVGGQTIGSVVFRALRTVPKNGGTSSYRVTVDVPEADAFNEKLIDYFKWTGFISFDFMQDELTGELFVIDVNPRIAPGVALGYFAGVDMLKAYVDYVCGNTVKRLDKQKTGVRSKLHFLDLGWMLYNALDHDLTRREKWECFGQWVKREKSRDDIFVWNDLRPMGMLYLFLLKNLKSFLGPHGGEVFLEHSLFDDELFHEQLQLEAIDAHHKTLAV